MCANINVSIMKCYMLGILVLLASVDTKVVQMRQDTPQQYPVCRTSSRCTREHASKNGFYYKVNGHQIIVDFLDGSYFTLLCDSDRRYSSMVLDDGEMPAMLWPVTVEVAVFNRCLIPYGTYHTALKAFNVTVTKTLKLALPSDSKLEAHHFEDLQITNLDMAGIDSSKPLHPSVDFLDKLPELRTLKLTDVIPEPEALSRLPSSLEILNIVNARLPTAERRLRNINNNSQHWLERLKSLQSVLLADSSTIVAESPADRITLPQLSSLPNLDSLSLYYMPLDPERLTDWLKHSTLKHLILKSCGLSTLSRSMFHGAQITKLILANNNLKSLPGGLFTPLKDSLQELDLSRNHLNNEDIKYSVHQLKRLEILKVNNNPLGSFCGDAKILKTPLPSQLPESLRKLELKNTSAVRICSDWIRNDGLVNIDLSYNNINELTYSDLAMNRTARGTVRVNLTHNKFRKIDVSKSDYELCLIHASTPTPENPSIITRVPVELELDKLACDCHAHWLREVLRDCSLLQLKTDVDCLLEPSPLHTTLLQYRPDEIFCPFSGYCLPECTCKNRPRDNATVVRCTGDLPENPQWPLTENTFPLALHVARETLAAVPNVTLVELYAPNNNITKLSEEDIPTTLQVLDVRNNSISHISLTAAQLLGNLRTRNVNHSVYLSGNPLTCECDDAPVFSHLKAVVRDWDSVKCVDMSLVSGKTERDLCPSSLPIVFGMVVPLLLLAVAGLLVHLLFHRVKQFMFRHDLFLDWILRDTDEIEELDKKCDVFLSYAHPDLKQLQELKYGLEKLGYSTIDHQINWQPGDSVLEQISSSVLNSRRTILLVSDNFAKSEWTPVEFNIAHKYALRTRTKRILIVRCGLTKPHKLPLDLRIYLENHTYLDWGTPKFWHKLCRFMPPPRQGVVQCRPDDIDPPSPLMHQNFPLLKKIPQQPLLAVPLLSATVPSAC